MSGVPFKAILSKSNECCGAGLPAAQDYLRRLTGLTGFQKKAFSKLAGRRGRRVLFVKDGAVPPGLFRPVEGLIGLFD
jgi:hypothetical protein